MSSLLQQVAKKIKIKLVGRQSLVSVPPKPEDVLVEVVNFFASRDTMSTQVQYETSFCPDYYQQMHEQNQAFAENNWLLEEIPTILRSRPNNITELACGNGSFSKTIAKHCNKV
jgi:tRNA/tmRNA/rRNA uracil-C5-methylase (TrmA/RlmC/RlmD family)